MQWKTKKLQNSYPEKCDTECIPKHIAIIMDGNGRWAQQQGLLRADGHKRGVLVLKDIVKFSNIMGIQALTVYAFSQENYGRPTVEIRKILELFDISLKDYREEAHNANIKLRFIGDMSPFPQTLYRSIEIAQNHTINNTGLELVVAVNYSGRWDITNACIKLNQKIQDSSIAIEDINESLFSQFLCLSDLPYPELLIRTGSEQRLSNYLLWHLAYTELYFEDCLWPDFTTEHLQKAIKWYSKRQRRFGCTSDQIEHA